MSTPFRDKIETIIRKILYSIAAALIITASVWAQSPEKISYQAIVRDVNNNLVTTQSVGMQISILQGSASGTAVYEETHSLSSNANGLISLEIGTGTIISGDFANIDWANDSYFIKTETDPTGGTNYTITGTTQLMSVPYALHAKTAESITGTINYTETDPIFEASIANGITALDTANWNNHTIDTDTHIDSTGIANLGFVAGVQTPSLSDVLVEGNDAGSNSISNLGKVTIGSSVPNNNAALDINVTNGALLLSRLNTTQQNSLTPLAGMVIYNTDESKFKGYKSEEKVDQEQTESNNHSGGIGQSFTAGSSGFLTAIEVEGDLGGNYLTLKVYEGEGMTDSLLLHSQTVSLGIGVRKFILSSPISVTSGQIYTFDFDGDSYTALFTTGNLYTAGNGYINDVIHITDMDWVFKTYIDDSGWVDLH